MSMRTEQDKINREEDNQRYIAWRSEEQVTPDIWNPTTSEWELGE